MKEKISQLLNNKNINYSEINEISVLANKVYQIIGDEIYYLKVFTNNDVHSYKILKQIYLKLKNTLSVPEVISAEKENKYINHPYILMKSVEGKPIQSQLHNLSEKELLDIYEHFGEVVAKLHSQTFELFGGYDGTVITEFEELAEAKTTTSYGPFNSWKEMHEQIILSRIEPLENGYFADIIPNIKSFFEKNSGLIDYNITPRLLHIDLNNKNVFVKNNKVSGLIDFDDCFIGHNEEELMRIEGGHFSKKPELKDAFFKGYTKHITLDDGYENRRPFYHLSRMLVHMDCIELFKENYVKDIQKEVLKVKEEVNNICEGRDITYNANTIVE